METKASQGEVGEGRGGEGRGGEGRIRKIDVSVFCGQCGKLLSK